MQRSFGKGNVGIGDFYAFENTFQGGVFFAAGRESAEYDDF
jgi:hypothetical protein